MWKAEEVAGAPVQVVVPRGPTLAAEDEMPVAGQSAAEEVTAPVGRSLEGRRAAVTRAGPEVPGPAEPRGPG